MRELHCFNRLLLPKLATHNNQTCRMRYLCPLRVSNINILVAAAQYYRLRFLKISWQNTKKWGSYIAATIYCCQNWQHTTIKHAECDIFVPFVFQTSVFWSQRHIIIDYASLKFHGKLLKNEGATQLQPSIASKMGQESSCLILIPNHNNLLPSNFIDALIQIVLLTQIYYYSSACP